MPLTAKEVLPGPHWVRAHPDADWFYLDIQKPDALLYGLAEAEFEPIRRPGDAVEGLPAGLPSQLYERNRRAEAALAAAMGDISKVQETMQAVNVLMSTEYDKVIIRIWAGGNRTKRQAAEEIHAVLPDWKTICHPEEKYLFISLERQVQGERIDVTIYGLVHDKPATEQEGQPE